MKYKQTSESEWYVLQLSVPHTNSNPSSEECENSLCFNKRSYDLVFDSKSNDILENPFKSKDEYMAVLQYYYPYFASWDTRNADDSFSKFVEAAWKNKKKLCSFLPQHHYSWTMQINAVAVYYQLYRFLKSEMT